MWPCPACALRRFQELWYFQQCSGQGHHTQAAVTRDKEKSCTLQRLQKDKHRAGEQEDTPYLLKGIVFPMRVNSLLHSPKREKKGRFSSRHKEIYATFSGVCHPILR